MSTQVIEVPRKRHRGRRALIAILVILVLLIAGFFVGDYFAKKAAASYVQQQVATALDLSSTKPVSVNLGSGSILLQALSGRIDTVDVSVDPLVVNGLSGTATLTATGVPLSSTVPVQSLGVVVRIPSTTIKTAIARVPVLAQYKPTVTIEKNAVGVTGTVYVFGLPQKVGLSMVPTVTAGKPGFSIAAASFDGVKISTQQLAKYIPGIASILKTGVSLCIANALPKSFVLTSITLDQNELVSHFTGNGVELNSATLQQKGTCSS